jgi:hypothetical protein
MLDPLVLKLVAIGFGLLFLLAAVHKLGDLPRFRATFAAYQVVPAGLVAPLGLALAVSEALLGAAWLLGIRPAATAVLSAALLVSYTAGIALNLKRGRVHIDCGCSMGRQAGRDQQLSWGLVARNAVLIAAALAATVPVSPRAVGPVDYMTLVAGLLGSVLLYAAANQLLSNGAAIGAWRKRHGGHSHD